MSPQADVTPPAAGTADTTAPRLFAGQEPTQAGVAAYTMLLPTDAQLDPAVVARAYVADILQRNGTLVDAETLDGLVAFARDTPATAAALAQPAWRLQSGPTRADGQPAAPFLGYAVPVPVAAQQSVLQQAPQIAQQIQTQAPPIDALIAQLRALAAGADEPGIVKTLDAVQSGIGSGRASDAAGNPIGESALRGVLEFAARMGREKEAAKILERYTAIKGVSADARQLGENAQRVFRGIDPATGQPIHTDQRVDAAFNLVSNGFKLAGDIGSTALLFGARAGGWAGALIGVAPVGVAVVAFAAGIYGLIKQAREAALAPQWEEFRERFPFAEGLKPKDAISRAMRQITGMPTGPDNAVSTSTRILELVGHDPQTRERYLAFLKQKVEPDSLVDALAQGRGLSGLTAEQAMLLAKASKQSVKEFFELELKDVKAFLRDRDGERERGAYLTVRAEPPRSAEQRAAQTRGDIGESLRVLGIAVGAAMQIGDTYKDLLGKLKGIGAVGEFSAEQQKNLAGSVLAASRQAGMPSVDALMLSRDGSKLIAVSNPQSEARQTVAVDLQAGARQSVETSSQLIAQQAVVATPGPARPVHSQPGL